MAASAAVLSSLSPQFLTTSTRSRKQPISKLTLLSRSFLPSSTPPTQSVRNHQQQHRGGLALEAVACLPSSSSSPKSATPLSTKLYVSGLSFRTTEEGLRNAFQDFGELVEVNLVMDRIANRPRGFAFLRYATVEESQRAIEGMHGKFLDGRVIFVEVAKPRPYLELSKSKRGLSFRTTEEGLRNAFQDFGELVEVNLVMDRIANRPRGFAFLRYATVEESQRAIEGMHGKFLDGRVIFVEVAKPRSELHQGSKQTPKHY